MCEHSRLAPDTKSIRLLIPKSGERDWAYLLIGERKIHMDAICVECGEKILLVNASTTKEAEYEEAEHNDSILVAKRGLNE